MALVECPNCKGQISDKAGRCVHCGIIFIPEEKKICEECGAEICEGNSICLNCGCPVKIADDVKPDMVFQQTETTGSAKFQRIRVLVVVVLLLAVMAAAAGIGIMQYQRKQEAREEEALRLSQERAAEEALLRSQEYSDNLELAVYTMLSGAADAETCCNLIQQVWSNAIWEKEDGETDRYTRPDGHFVEDFNDALDHLFADPDFIKQLDGITENQDSVNQIIKELRNPPEEYRDAYGALSEYYDAYLTFTNMAVSPTGSLDTFSKDFKEIDEQCLHCYQIMLFYLQE